MARDKDAYAYPPRGMSRIDAARYVGVGVSKFDELVRDGRMPKPRHIDSRRIWDRIELDAHFDDLVYGKPANEIDAALEKSRADAAIRAALAAARQLRKTAKGT